MGRWDSWAFERFERQKGQARSMMMAGIVLGLLTLMVALGQMGKESTAADCSRAICFDTLRGSDGSLLLGLEAAALLLLIMGLSRFLRARVALSDVLEEEA